ncbi:hypothetical protein [Halorussus salinus]|uniref:hypothetical protein n=1 Tax=Halorussus salinus TaxID=1364935 RepID=UPI00109274B7|nr:hypothetical protein [Halorussus salinus]
MRRSVILIGFVAVSTLLAASAGTAASVADPVAASALADQIDAQTDATTAALAAAEDPWVPRIAGAGLGLAVGLVGGGVVAYVNRGESG